MNVLIISHMYPNKLNPIKGIFVHQQAKALIEMGCDVRVIAPIPKAFFPLNRLSQKWKNYSMVPLDVVLDNVEVHYPRYITFPQGFMMASSGIRMYHGSKKVVSGVLTNFTPDLIHAHVALPDGVMAMKLSRKLKIPFIVTIHGQDLQHTIYKNQSCYKKIYQVFKASSQIVLVSEKLRKVAKKELGFESKLTVISNGIDQEVIPERLPNANTKKEINILSVSNLVNTKGIDLNILAIRKLVKDYPNLKYLIIGSGRERPVLEQLVKDCNLTEHVQFLGRVDHSNVIKHMRNCDIFCLPSWQEGFGVVYIEAMSQGKVVIACREEGIDGVVIDGKNGFLVKKKNVDDIVKTIQYVLENPEIKTQVERNAYLTVLNRYTWQSNAKEYVNLYQQSIGEN